MESRLADLEEKVLKAIQRIQDLRAENAQLQLQRDELRGLCEVLKEDNQKLSRQLGESQAAAASLENFEEKRRLMEEKVGGLLEKLAQIG
jgi:predicted  nucleic acid-binding Zn-ribbon protein